MSILRGALQASRNTSIPSSFACTSIFSRSFSSRFQAERRETRPYRDVRLTPTHQASRALLKNPLPIPPRAIPPSPLDAATGNLPSSSNAVLPLPTNGRMLPTPATPADIFVSRATRPASKSKMTNLSISQQKLNDICRNVRGLNVQEALIQLRLSPRVKANWVRHALQRAANYAVINFNMDASRLYVSECRVGKGPTIKRPDYKGRGRVGTKYVYKSHLYCEVREQGTDRNDWGGFWAPWGASWTGDQEVRIGRVGRTHETIKHTIDRMVHWRTKIGLSPKPIKGAHQDDAKKAYQALGTPTDLQTVFGKKQ